MLSRYSDTLEAPGIRALLLNSLFARLPLGMLSLAMLLFVRSHTGSYAIAGLAVGASTVASAAAAPVLGGLLDRLGARRVLGPCAAVQTALLVALALAGDANAPAGVLIALAAGIGAILPPISACVRALWPSVTSGPAELEAIFALDATTQELIWAVGPLLIAVALNLSSTAAAVLMCAAITLVGTGAFLTSRPVRAWHTDRSDMPSPSSQSLPGRGVRPLLGAVALSGLMVGNIEVGLPALATHMHRSPGTGGLLLAMWSVGSLIGGFTYGMRERNGSAEVRHRRIMLTAGLLVTPLIVAKSLPAVFVLTMLAGVSLAPMMSCQYSLISSLAARGAAAKAFTWQTAALITGVAAGNALGGVISDNFGGHAPFVLAAAAAVCGFSLVRARPLSGPRQAEPPESPAVDGQPLESSWADPQGRPGSTLGVATVTICDESTGSSARRSR